MMNTVWDCRNSQAGQAGKSLSKRIRVTASGFDPPWHFCEGYAPERRLHLRHSPVGAERLMEPTKTFSVLEAVNGSIVLTMVLETPRALPNLGVVRREHSSFAAGRHNFVLAERKGCDVSDRSDRAAFVQRSLSLCTVFDDSQVVLRS